MARKFSLLLIFIAFALVFSGCSLYQNSQTAGGENNTQEKGSPAGEVEGALTVRATEDGFEPSVVTVKSGEAITWVNETSRTVQVGSDAHPTHTVNPDLTGGEFVMEITPGESKTVTVTEVGTWGYHDHLATQKTGTVVVE